MRAAVLKFFGDIQRIFTGRNLIWHGIAIALTWFLVVSGFDWWVTSNVRELNFHQFIRLGSAGFVGFLVPFVLPGILLLIGVIRKHTHAITVALLIAQAEITGLLLSFFYKALTGRPGPVGLNFDITAIDTSTVFNFGFLRGGVFWGWPSSHITVAVSAAVLLMVLYAKYPIIKYTALLYAIYMAISVSLTFHWFSDGVAGVIFGSLVGTTVARSAVRMRKGS